MPIVKASVEKIAQLREMIAAWPQLRAALPQLLALATPTANRVTPEKPEIVRPNPDGSYWFQIASSSSVGTNQWNYKGRMMKFGHTTSLTGLVMTADTIEHDLRNAVETVALGGLTDIDSLSAIATGSVVKAWPGDRDGARIYVFERMNDVVCA